MNWSNVKLILAREVRDQLRDRRTLFMIFVLPILLYPLLGMSFFQISQFLEERPSSVWVVGAKDLEDLPPLVKNDRFCGALFGDPDKARLLELHFAPDEPRGKRALPSDPLAAARNAVLAGRYDAALCFPAEFAEQMGAFREAIEHRAERVERVETEDGRVGEVESPPRVPSPEIIYTTANEKSQIAFARLSHVLRRWAEEVGKDSLAATGVPPSAARPFELQTADMAERTGSRGGAMWSKLLPVMLLLWALTGAFYPAVDLCAGEKERGTLETLLSSPAERSEIVLGKLATIMLFSIITVVLNLLSIGLTGWVVLARLPAIGPPPAMAVIWLSLALIPVSALFSALCLALAAFARSTKEGQYYLMPLLLVTMPLAILPMAPGVELNLGNSLIPITNVVLLLRSTMEGNYWAAARFVAPVAAVTLACCLLAIRWAVDQFNAESVLFRESERLDVALWLQHLFRDRQPTPTVAGAVFCGVVILMVKFFMGFAMPAPEVFRDLATVIVVTELVVVATPALLMAVMLTSSPGRTLLVDRRSWRWHVLLAVPAAMVLAVALHPVISVLQTVVIRLYPLSRHVAALEGLFKEAGFWQLVLVAAVLPAVCEELAFRGFILSGFRHLGHKWRAIVYSALFFALAHGILQQSLIACLVGMVIGLVAVQSGNLLPGVAFHMLHNTLALAAAQITPRAVARWPIFELILAPAAGNAGYTYRWPVVLAGGIAAVLLLAWFGRLPHRKTKEERLQKAIQRG